MKIVKLKEDFIKRALEISPTFSQKNNRPYLILIVLGKSKYLVPFRSNIKRGVYSYIFDGGANGKGLDFRGSFKLVNDNIILSNRSLPNEDYRHIADNIKKIEIMYNSYLKLNTYTDFEKKLIELQKNF